MRRSMAALAIGMTVVCCPRAGAALIDFSALTAGTAVTNQYPDATFSSVAGEENRVLDDYNFGANSFPHYICTAAVGGELDCASPVYVDFTAPVSGLTFYTLGDDVAGTPASVDVYAGATLLGNVPIVVDGNFSTIHLVNLTAYSGVTRIEISGNTDTNGLAYDTFSFEVVPEPGMGIIVAGAGVVSAIMRRARGERITNHQ